MTTPKKISALNALKNKYVSGLVNKETVKKTIKPLKLQVNKNTTCQVSDSVPSSCLGHSLRRWHTRTFQGILHRGGIHDTSCYCTWRGTHRGCRQSSHPWYGWLHREKKWTKSKIYFKPVVVVSFRRLVNHLTAVTDEMKFDALLQTPKHLLRTIIHTIKRELPI